MRTVAVLGAGKIGSLISTFLAESGDYDVHLVDIDQASLNRLGSEPAQPRLNATALDVTDKSAMDHFVSTNNIQSVISSLPYYCNPPVAELARSHGLAYFDLTEDIEVTNHIKSVSKGAAHAFIPQCGLAPGFISIAAHELMNHFETPETVKMRVGALPVNPNNALKYSLTWSTDGLINEYGNLCFGIEQGERVPLMPLEGYETIEVDGLLYEAFNTSGGLGTLADTYAGKVKTMNYKTLRYPGHCEKIQLLMKDLQLNEDRDTLKRILERAVPKTLQDVVVIYASVTGRRQGDLYEETYVKKIYPQTIGPRKWSAIQVTTAAGMCSVVDIVSSRPSQYQGFVTQETFSFQDIVSNRFGQYFK